jgi:predicted outer membrane repeat protein
MLVAIGAGTESADAFSCTVSGGDGAGLIAALANTSCTEIDLEEGTYSSPSGFTIDRDVELAGLGAYGFYSTLTRTGPGPVLTVSGGVPVVVDVTITGASDGPGIAVTTDGGTTADPAVISNSQVSDNTNSGPGGGIAYSGDGFLRLEYDEISSNGASSGGGISNSGGGTLSVDHGFIASNSASGDGGGFAVSSGTGTTNFKDVTFDGNHADSSGGAIATSASGATTTLNNVTIAGNRADANNGGGGAGGGVAVTGGGPVAISNSIIANNAVGSTGAQVDCADDTSKLTRLGYELIRSACPHGYASNGPFNDTAAGYQTSVAPLLGPIANNNGLGDPLTNTRELEVGSPAVNAGNPAPPTGSAGTCELDDERGVPRPRGLACDLGALEVSPPSCGSNAVPMAGVPNAPTNYVLTCDGDPFRYEIPSNPANGAVSNLDPVTGTFTYTPNSGFSGQDPVIYRGVNGGGASFTATLLVSVLPFTGPFGPPPGPPSHTPKCKRKHKRKKHSRSVSNGRKKRCKKKRR